MWNIKDKICLITGATSGIGEATAIELARHGAKVVFTYRNAHKADETIKRIHYISNNEPDAFFCDFSSFDSIREFAKLFLNKYEKLDVLINNMGVWETERKMSKDNIELNFATNHLAPFLLTNLLLDLLKKSTLSRIINVSSGAHTSAEINFNDIELKHKFSGFKSYAQSKLANILFTKMLAEKLAETGITVNCLHPGVVATNIFNNMNRFAVLLFKPFLISPEKGAETSVYLAVSDEVSRLSGKYFKKKKITKSSSASNDMAVAARLWQISSTYTGLK